MKGVFTPPIRIEGFSHRSLRYHANPFVTDYPSAPASPKEQTEQTHEYFLEPNHCGTPVKSSGGAHLSLGRGARVDDDSHR